MHLAKRKYTIALHERRVNPHKTLGNCPCGQKAITNNAAGCPACAHCLETEQSFAIAEGNRSAIESKLGNLGKYMERTYRAVTPHHLESY